MNQLPYRNRWLFGAILISFLACKSKKSIVPPPPPVLTVKSVEDPNFIFSEAVKKIIFTPSFFHSKASISAVMNGNALDFDAVIQFRKDSAILIVVKKFGFEAGRALITPDSFFVINRLQQEFDAKPLSAISQRLNLPPRFDLIQDLLVGNPMNLGKTPYKVNTKDSLATLSSSHEANLATCFLDKKNYRLYETTVEMAQGQGDITMTYGDFRPIRTRTFPFQRSIEAQNKSTGTLEATIRFNEVEFDTPRIIRFDIPKKYKRMD